MASNQHHTFTLEHGNFPSKVFRCFNPTRHFYIIIIIIIIIIIMRVTIAILQCHYSSNIQLKGKLWIDIVILCIIILTR